MATTVEQRSVSVRIDGKEVENSFKAISAEVRALRTETQKLSEGTAEYVVKTLSLAQANEAAKRNQDSVKEIADAWKLMPEAVRQSVSTMQGSLLVLKGEFKDLGSIKTPEMTGLEADMAAITAQVKETRAQFRETEASVKDNITGISTKLKDLKEDYQKLADAGADLKSPEMKALKADIKAVSDELKDTKTQYSHLKTEQQATLKAMQDNLATLKKRYEELSKAQKEASTPEMKALEAEIHKVQEEIAKTTRQYVELGRVAPLSLQGLEDSYADLYKEIKKTDAAAEGYEKKVERLKQLEVQIDEHKKGLKGIEEGWMKNIPAVATFAAAAVAAFAVDKLREFGSALMHNAVEMDTNLRKAASVLANDLGKINNEAEKHAHTFGIARSQYVGAAADMSAFFQSQFASREEGAKLGNEAVKLAGILAGFKGGGAEQFAEALEAMKGGFSDNVEELAKFNIALSDDIIKATLAERGIDKLSAKQQEHAKGLVLLELIQKKATAQIQAFGDTSGSVARNAAELEAMLKEIGDTLSKILIPILSAALIVIKPVLDALGDIADAAFEAANPLQALTEEFRQQKDKVADLEKTYIPLMARYDVLANKMKLSKKEQTELKEITEKIGEAIPKATAATDQYGKAIIINTQAGREYIEMEKVRLAYINKAAIAEAESALAQLTQRHQTEKFILDAKEKSGLVASTTTMAYISGTVKLTDEQLKDQQGKVLQLQNDIEKMAKNIRELNGENIKLPEAPKPDLSGKTQQEMTDAANRAKQIQNELKRLREAVKAHESDLLAQNMRDDERDEERIREKYRKDIELAQSLEKEKGKIGEEARKLRVELEETRDNEVAAKKKENAEKIIDDLKKLSAKYSVNEGDLLLDELQKKLAAIKAKFADEFAKVTKAETSKDPSVKAQAQQTRVDLEKAENAEMEAERTRHVMELAKKQDELWQKTQLANADGMEKEILQVIFQHQNLIDENIKNGDEIARLVESQEKQITEIRRKYREADLKDKRDKDLKHAKFERELGDAKNELEQKKFENLKGFANLAGALLGENAKSNVAYFALMKGLAIAEIIITAQREAAAISFAYAQKAAAYALIPGKSEQLIAVGVSLAAATLAKGFINAATVGIMAIAEFKANQKAEGGYSDVVGAQDGKTYRARNAGRATTGPVLDPTVFLAGEQPEYVIAYPETKNPIVANLIGVAESIRQRRVRGYEGGGFTEVTDTATASPRTASSTASAPQSVGNENAALIAVINRFIGVIETGIFAKFTTEDAFALKKLQNKAVTLAGYEP